MTSLNIEPVLQWRHMARDSSYNSKCDITHIKKQIQELAQKVGNTPQVFYSASFLIILVFGKT